MGRIAIFILVMACVRLASAAIVFDDFTTDQSGTGWLEIMDVIGGERDIRTANPGNTVAVNGNAFSCSGPNAFSGCALDYDGIDHDASSTLTIPGFSPMDLTTGGQGAISVDVNVVQGGCNLSVELCDGQSTPMCASPGITDVASGTHKFDYSDFTGVDPTQITAIRFVLTLRSNPSDCRISAVGTTLGDYIFSDGFE